MAATAKTPTAAGALDERLLVTAHGWYWGDATPRPSSVKPAPSFRHFVTEHRDKPMGVHGLHKWWYRCLQRAGIVAEGVTHGRKMHMARHTAGQSVLDRTGNLKAVQKLLGHSSITTTGDIYTDWDIDQLEETMRFVVGEGDADGGL
jgi:integrase